MRPTCYWLIPQAARIRKAVKDSHPIIDPEGERRKAIVEEALAAGKKPPKMADTLCWMYEIAWAKNLNNVDYSATQLALNMATIRTTTETTCQALLDICEYPEVADQLRKEIVEVPSKVGWTKTSLYKPKLIDSF